MRYHDSTGVLGKMIELREPFILDKSMSKTLYLTANVRGPGGRIDHVPW
jgi:hypothetical protein